MSGIGEAAAVAGGPIVQMCWAVESIEHAVPAWVESVGAGPFFLAAHIQFGNLTYRGRAATLDQSSAVGQWGGVQLELLEQHCQSPSGVLEMRAAGQTGLQHVTWFSDDLDAETARMAGLGFQEVMTATLPVMGGMRIAWFDARALLGCMVEVYEESDLMRRFYRRVARAADGWDGSDPLRPL
jgi:hypothetical protein